jgi:L-fucose mutarotase/ribose pyranase (RbsD/FucU family)
MTPNWKELLKDRLRLYGHRNWLVVADSAYPAQSRQAIETIVVDEEQITVLEGTLAILGGLGRCPNLARTAVALGRVCRLSAAHEDFLRDTTLCIEITARAFSPT